jgi:hypothetical protein
VNLSRAQGHGPAAEWRWVASINAMTATIDATARDEK